MTRTPANRTAGPLSLVVAVLMIVAACTPPQRIYSTSPVDRYGQPLPYDQVVRLRFEDGTELDIPSDKRLVLVGATFELADRRGYTDEESPGWRVSQVAEVEWITPDGETEIAEIMSPDDLRRFDRLPRVYRIDLVDGRTIDLSDAPREPTWSPNGLELEIPGAGDEMESIPLEDIDTIILHDASVVKSTLASPRFWLATAAGVVVFLWIADRAKDQDNATK